MDNKLTKEERKEVNRLKRQEEFINKFIAKWGSENFDFSEVYYVNHEIPVIIKHKEFGIRTTSPDFFLKKNFTQIRSWDEYKDDYRNQRSKDFLKKIKNYFGDYFIIDNNIEYKDIKTPVSLIERKSGKIQTKTPLGFFAAGKKFKKNQELLTNKQKDFIQKVQARFGNKFDFRDVHYINSSTPVILHCKDHNDYKFSIRPDDLLKSKYGCPLCTQEHCAQNRIEEKASDFLNTVQKRFEGKLDFSKSVYTGASNYINFICYQHGDQQALAHNLLWTKYGCPECAKEAVSSSIKLTKEEFIEKAVAVHGNKYDYSKVVYINSTTPVEIYCKECQEYFWQIPSNHIYNKGHIKCYGWTRRTQEEFIKECEARYNGVFDFSFVKFIDMATPVEIVCKTCGKHFSEDQPIY